ncbi:AcrR family transcriptional regulator [Mycetocola sp. CAN_C7]|uniref:TetR family transcriptional regulator n=1 Tax=Mycetocola sp. CAN_C7 TaxID=2787724 RepID=UPI0018CB8523
MSEGVGAVGRPRRSSQRILEEAAAELFLEQTYAGTTIDQIAARAGVSRNTFFNYFPSKGDLLWVDFDQTMSGLAAALSEVDPDRPPMDAVRAAITAVAASHPADSVPWALTQYELMGTQDELQASGLARFMKQAAVLDRYLVERLGTSVESTQAIAFAVLAAAAAAAGVWARAGVRRRPLADYVDAAIAPICDGFTRAL